MTKVRTRNESIETSMDIMRNALKRKISVTEASRLAGKGKNYVSNTKLSLDRKVAANVASKKEVVEFKRLYKEYERAVIA